MRRVRTSALVLAAIAAGAVAQDEKPKPDDQLQKLFDRLSAVIRESGIDLAKDGLRAMQAKERKARDAVAEFSRRLLELQSNPRVATNYGFFLAATTPRLSGRVLRIGKGERYRTPFEARDAIRPGDLILVGAGDFYLPEDEKWRDVALVGSGAGSTTLRGQLEHANRVRIADVRWQCDDDECVVLRRDGAIQLFGCFITGYNSGAGGSNAVFATQSTLLIERCEFEGKSGRVGDEPSRFGNPLDLRAPFSLFARACSFVDNSAIVRVSDTCVFDRCRTSGDDGARIYEGGGRLFVRDNDVAVRGDFAVEFERAADDRDVVAFLRSKVAREQDAALVAFDDPGLRRNLRFWGALLGHSVREIRYLAKARLEVLLKGALPKLTVPDRIVRQVPKKMRRGFAALVQAGRVLNWLEANGDGLRWDARAGVYRVAAKRRP